MKKTKRKFKVVKKIATITIVTGLYLALNPKNIIEEYSRSLIPFTEEDLINNVKFYVELENIKAENEIKFNNIEIYNIIKSLLGKDPVKTDLENIEELTIINKLSNPDLSDLKYLTNLSSLYIMNNDIDCSDIKYNQNLSYLKTLECTISNTIDLPNTLEYIELKTSKCLDSSLVVPYLTKKLYINNTVINNLHLKNPTILTRLMINTSSIIDLNKIKDCTNLEELLLISCSNIKNPEVLKTFTNLDELIVDDYITIWSNKELIESLPISKEEKEKYIEEVEALDIIAKTITSKEDFDTEKIAQLSVYVLKRISYDKRIADNPKENKDIIIDYNKRPIEYSLNNQIGICINYACLFQALLNRVGIENYQFTNANHTWNVIYEDNKYKGYDLTYLDENSILEMEDDNTAIVSIKTSEEIIQDGQGEKLLFYSFDIDEQAHDYHQADQTLQQMEQLIKNIGYINGKSKIKILINNKEIVTTIKNITELIILLSFLIFAIKIHKLQYKESENNEKDIKKYEKKYQ